MVNMYTPQALIRAFPTHFTDNQVGIPVTIDIACSFDIGSEKAVDGFTGFNPYWIWIQTGHKTRIKLDSTCCVTGVIVLTWCPYEDVIIAIAICIANHGQRGSEACTFVKSDECEVRRCRIAIHRTIVNVNSTGIIVRPWFTIDEITVSVGVVIAIGIGIGTEISGCIGFENKERVGSDATIVTTRHITNDSQTCAIVNSVDELSTGGGVEVMPKRLTYSLTFVDD